MIMSRLTVGDYVLATKYKDGSSRDQWCCGFYKGMTDHNPPRYEIVDGDGNLFRGNGFRRCERIHPAMGKYLVDNIAHLNMNTYDLWGCGLIDDMVRNITVEG